jgi:uncharacterized membrane protein YdcZ (DUF606 family)
VSYWERLKSNEGNLFAIGIAWTVGLLWFTVGGFYFGTIVTRQKEIDLQLPQIQGGLQWAGIGFGVGVVVATLITIFYPRATAADDAHEPHTEH